MNSKVTACVVIAVAAFAGFRYLFDIPTMNPKKAFVLLVALTFKTAEDKQTFSQMFAKLAIYVANKEPATLSYELADSDKDPLRVVIIERYVNKDAYLTIHKGSEQFIEFRKQMSKIDITIDGHR